MRAISLALLALTVPVAAERQSRPSDRPPNVIVILADDMGWADMRNHGSRIDTPALDRLAREGMKLTQFYASSPFCSPTRAALLTGRYPHSVGVPELTLEQPDSSGRLFALDHAALTLPEALKPRGYTSVLVGKWHLGYPRSHWPRAHGFDEFWGSLAGTPGNYTVRDTYHNETPIKATRYYTDEITDHAVGYIEQLRDRPFFLYLAYNAPHQPLEAPQELIDKYRPRYADERFAKYAAMVDRMDQGIGRVLEALDRLGLAENTLVFFSTDNGPNAIQEAVGLEGARVSAGGLRGHKFSTWEGGIRVPLLARWPGRIPGGVARDEVSLTMDLMPTILEAAGVRATHEMHGASLLGLLSNRPFREERTLHWENQHNLAVRRGRWKLVHQFWAEKPQLYDLEADPYEANDLASRQPKLVAELSRAHEAWMRRHYPSPVPRREQRSLRNFPVE